MASLEDSILIHAPLSRVVTVARDNEQFPQFMTDVESLTVTERSPDNLRVVSEWVGVVPQFGIKTRWTEEDVWAIGEAVATCTFRQLTGDFDEFGGVWTFTRESEMQTRFHSQLTYRLEIPLVGALIQTLIDKTMRANLAATLEAIKTRSENTR